MSVSKDGDDLTALVVGAGAVVNAWAPVLRALRPHFPFQLTPDAANAFLARVVYLLRWYSSVSGTEAEDPQHLEDLRAMWRAIRQRISEEVAAAEGSGELQVRPEFDSIVDRFLIERSRRAIVITTNWDHVVEAALAKRLGNRLGGTAEALHIHGSTSKHDTVYLPTEVVREPYRSKEEEQELGAIHTTIMHALEAAKCVVLYGISLSPLDAELGQTLASGWSGQHLEQIDVIVPDHEIVAQRVNVLLSPTAVRILGYDPAKLDAPTDYTFAAPAHA
jgi:hypothetical protein